MKSQLIISLLALLVLVQTKIKKQTQDPQVQHFDYNNLSNCNNPPSVPGQNQLGVATDLLKLDTKENIFEFSCKNHELSLDGTQLIIDGTDLDVMMQFNQQQKTLVAQNAQQFEGFKLSTFNTNIDTRECSEYAFKLNVVAGELNVNSKNIEQKLKDGKQTYQIMSTKYKQYRTSITDYSKMSLSTEFLNALKALPDQYDEDTYIAFFKKYGTHYREGVIMGGLISQVGYTSVDYSTDTRDLGNQFDQFFAQNLQNNNLSLNHIPNQLQNPNIDDDYIRQSDFEPFHIAGGKHPQGSLLEWVKSIGERPTVVEQRLVNMTNLIRDELIPTPLKGKIPYLKPNINRGLKAYLIDSSGCTDKKAINYDPKAQIHDGSCYYSAFYGSYQTATGNCPTTFQQKYQLPNPITQDVTCPAGTTPQYVGIYTIDNCDLKQYFCMRDNVPKDKVDLQQSLQVCQARSVTNRFYEDSKQYLCNIEEQENVFNIKYAQKKVIYTCTQHWCLDQGQGAEFFVNEHVGTCSGFSVDKDSEKQGIQNCDGACLIQYGLVSLASDCDIHQYICVQNQFDAQCVN